MGGACAKHLACCNWSESNKVIFRYLRCYYWRSWAKISVAWPNIDFHPSKIRCFLTWTHPRSRRLEQALEDSRISFARTQKLPLFEKWRKRYLRKTSLIKWAQGYWAHEAMATTVEGHNRNYSPKCCSYTISISIGCTPVQNIGRLSNSVYNAKSSDIWTRGIVTSPSNGPLLDTRSYYILQSLIFNLRSIYTNNVNK